MFVGVVSSWIFSLWWWKWLLALAPFHSCSWPFSSHHIFMLVSVKLPLSSSYLACHKETFYKMHSACKSCFHANHTWSLKPALLLILVVHPWRRCMTTNHSASAVLLTILLCFAPLVLPRMTCWSSPMLVALMLTFLPATAQEDLKVKIVTINHLFAALFLCFCVLSMHHLSYHLLRIVL